jgi:hypothetical protein
VGGQTLKLRDDLQMRKKTSPLKTSLLLRQSSAAKLVSGLTVPVSKP